MPTGAASYGSGRTVRGRKTTTGSKVAKKGGSMRKGTRRSKSKKGK